MIRFFPMLPFILGAFVSCSALSATADDSKEVYEQEIDASVEDVWRAFSTSEGLAKWMAPLVEIDLAIGGKMKSNYNAEGEIGDATTIENTILCYDPLRMISLKATKFPAGFEFAEAAKNTWSIFYFHKLSPTRTKITIVGLGYTDDELSRKMRSFFKGANKYSLDKLSAALADPKQTPTE